jgi:hypothetical protein
MFPSRVEDYTTIDVGGDWPRLRLLCEEPKPRLALECAMRRWLKYDAKWHHESLNWTLRRALQGEAPAPWELSRNGDWTCRIDSAVQEAVETKDTTAVVGHYAEMATFATESAQDGDLAAVLHPKTCAPKSILDQSGNISPIR